jgi:hypothetical protein
VEGRALLLKNRPYVLTMLGLALMAQSVLWEYVRMQPTYRFYIEPWSIRGFATTQGVVILVAALWLAALVTLQVLGVVKETLSHTIVAVGLTSLLPVVLAVFFDTKDLVLGGMGVGLLAFLGSIVVTVLIGRFLLPKSFRGPVRAAARIGGWVVSLLLLMLAFDPLFGSKSAPAWLVMLVVFTLVAVLSITRPPARLAVWRMMINGVVALWIMTITMGASLRWELLGQQIDKFGVSGEIGDAQVTAGILLCWLGGLLAFAGTVSLWAKRRDVLAARDRARHQQEAARESQAQLAESPV